MAQIELIMPKMGESIIEATIIKWVKKVGDKIKADETILEIATDKVDSEVPSPVSGTLSKILFAENDVVKIGSTIALIATEGEEILPEPAKDKGEPAAANGNYSGEAPSLANKALKENQLTTFEKGIESNVGGRFYSPLVRNIAQKENITGQELNQLQGTGLQGRVTKKDILSYVENRKDAVLPNVQYAPSASPIFEPSETGKSISGNVEIIEMDRMRRLIADHMVHSKRTSPHVTSFIEVDVTNIVNWRNKVKDEFFARHKEKITFTPFFIEAVARALQDFPMVNVSVDGYKIIVKKDINIGMATALPTGNLIVPVIKNANLLNLVGLTKKVNDLSERARKNVLKPEEIQDGTFTVTNVGTFGNVMGVPIINQPQAAILSTGVIKKKPAVLETEYGDVIAIRQMMFLSLSYDHRVIDGMLGGSFLSRIGRYLEAFDGQQV